MNHSAWAKHSERGPAVIELVGPDGSGKTTLLQRLLALDATRAGTFVRTVSVPRPPGQWFHSAAQELEAYGLTSSTPLGLMLRHALAWREEVLAEAISHPGIADCSLVFDRHVIGLVAYYSYLGLRQADKLMCGLKAAMPNKAVLLDIPAEVCLERIIQRGGVVEHHERSLERLESIRLAGIEVLSGLAIPTLTIGTSDVGEEDVVLRWLSETDPI